MTEATSTTEPADVTDDTDLDGQEGASGPPRRPNPLGRVVFLLITAGCFVYLYYRLNGAAAREGLSAGWTT